MAVAVVAATRKGSARRELPTPGAEAALPIAALSPFVV
jgi:hypothetical protein